MASLVLVMIPLFSIHANAANIKTDSVKLVHFVDSLVKVFEDDGLSAGQFGGVKGKKFNTTRFKALLLEIHQLPMANQKQKLREIFEGWQSSYSQVDDVSILGLRF